MLDAGSEQNKTHKPIWLIKPQAKIDLIVDMDYLSGKADVRSSMIIDISKNSIIAAQTNPEILKSRIGKKVEITMVHINKLTLESKRWGWSSRILDLDNDYRLNINDAVETTAVIFLAPPPGNKLHESNIRQAYRLEIGLNKGIEIILQNKEASITPMNFSAGGFMISTDGPPEFLLGEELPFNMSFQINQGREASKINGTAIVVRLEYVPGDRKSIIGLKFTELSTASKRSMEKVINFYMLAEQRRRNRM